MPKPKPILYDTVPTCQDSPPLTETHRKSLQNPEVLPTIGGTKPDDNTNGASPNQTVYSVEVKPRKRKSASEILGNVMGRNKRRQPHEQQLTSKSTSDIHGQNRATLDHLLLNDQDDNAEDTPKKGKPKPVAEAVGEEKIELGCQGSLRYVQKQHVTPTSVCTTATMDDGYESCNSTPHGSSDGRTKNWKHTNPSSTLVLTCTLRKKDLHVQLEEDEQFESFALSSTGSNSSSGHLAGDKSSVNDIPGDDGDLVGDGRETWGSNLDFLLSIIGFAVDLANVWRFPYLCYRNGGGAFLIPYTLMLVFGAVPLFYMELILGQFNRLGPISVWRICPLFKGVGFCAVLVAFFVSFYYNVIIAWSVFFLVSSISKELPWIYCNNTWNTDSCWDNMTTLAKNISESGRNTPASEYFHRGVLEMQYSEGLHDVGYPRWQLAICLFVVYTMLYISLFKGVKSSGKVVWITATMPYVVLTILLIRGLMLPGALQGISYYLNPELSKLKETQVWVDAAVQIFFSVGAGFGVHLSYASYNTFHNNCYRDVIVTTAVNSLTSFFSGFVIFTYLGYMSVKQGVHISTVATEGPGLVFQVYPEAVATLPGSHLWSMLFFFMLIMLGLDSGMGGLECVITGLMDEFGRLFKVKGWKYSREIFTLIIISMSFSVALVNVTPGGIYMFHLFDTYAAGISLLCSALFEAIAVSWFYGLDRFSQDVEAMLGFKPGIYWRICWKFISPLFLIAIVMFDLLYHQPLEYNEYNYPNWAEWIGWTLALSSIMMIPIVAIIQLLLTPGTFKERLAICISPIEEHQQIRDSKLVNRFKAKHWLYL